MLLIPRRGLWKSLSFKRDWGGLCRGLLVGTMVGWNAALFIQALVVTMDNVPYWFFLTVRKGSNEGNMMLKTEVGDGK